MGTNVTKKNVEVLTNCDIVFLGVKPAYLSEAIDQCRTVGSLDKNVMVVSMLAGVNISRLRDELSKIATLEKFKIVRIMPNTPMTIGAGACLYTPDSNVDDSECVKLDKLLSTSSICEKVPEHMMDTLGVLTACGPAFMYVVIEALADGAVKQGVPRAAAQRFAAQVAAASGQMVLLSGKHPGLLKDEVCSPGGSTICGVTALENGKLRATLINAIEAATLRTKGMSK